MLKGAARPITAGMHAPVTSHKYQVTIVFGESWEFYSSPGVRIGALGHHMIVQFDWTRNVAIDAHLSVGIGQRRIFSAPWHSSQAYRSLPW